MNSVYFMTECQILWGTWQLQTFWICKARNYLLTHITNKCWYLSYPALSDDPFELFMMLYTRVKSLVPVKRQRHFLGQIFKTSSSSSETWSAGEKSQAKWQWDGSKKMLWATPCSWGMFWGQRCLLVLHHNGNALYCSGKLTDCYLHQYFLLKSKIQGAALIF